MILVDRSLIKGSKESGYLVLILGSIMLRAKNLTVSNILYHK